MIATGATPHQIADIVMQDINLTDAVKAALLKDVDDQCRKLCEKSEESSVLCVPWSKHKVIVLNYFCWVTKIKKYLLQILDSKGTPWLIISQNM